MAFEPVKLLDDLLNAGVRALEVLAASVCSLSLPRSAPNVALQGQ